MLDGVSPPANLRAEQALLGALLANNRALSRVEEFLLVEHFADELHGRIYRLIVDRVRQGRVADVVSLQGDVEGDPSFEPVGGARYLVELLGAMVGVIGAAEYGLAIRDSWIRRQIIDACSDAVTSALQPPDGGGSAVMEALEASLLRIVAGAGDHAPTVSMGDAVGRALDGTREALERRGGLAGISTGYLALDRATTGLMAGEVYVLAARPAMGKTALGLGIAMRAAAAGAPTLFWSGEMTAAQLGARAAAAFADLPTTAVFTGRRLPMPDHAVDAVPQALGMGDWSALSDAEREAARLPLDIDDRPALTVAALRTRARRLKRGRRGLLLLVVDYLGLMRGSDAARRNGRYAETTEISGDLKSLAKELMIPVVALSQLNRANEAREDKRPTLADLRDSGAIEQDAGVVMFLHRQHYYLSREGEPTRRERETDEQYANRVSALAQRMESSFGEAEVIFAKNRHGPTGTRRMRFTDETTWFRDEGEDRLSPAWEIQALPT